MPEVQGPLQPFTIAGIEVPGRGGFRYEPARKIFDAMHNAITASEENPTDALFAYLTTQGIQTAEQVMLLHKALDIPVGRRKNPFTETDAAIVAALTDITGRLNMPQRLPSEDLGPRETASDLRRGTLRLPKRR